ncbi:hypothetical protein HNQ70_003254 [Quisquiliibacterium transsilvanicum]|uniref:Uncharacterized protein n=1 Tax=Quisquiliibacterium transsilvanicum TaxID=1549638 RepID=A0A7W8HJJ1_9BURK|nr:hypothetical protein [Quisquiliibacterium transsilvanicum]
MMMIVILEVNTLMMLDINVYSPLEQDDQPHLDHR